MKGWREIEREGLSAGDGERTLVKDRKGQGIGDTGRQREADFATVTWFLSLLFSAFLYI